MPILKAKVIPESEEADNVEKVQQEWNKLDKNLDDISEMVKDIKDEEEEQSRKDSFKKSAMSIQKASSVARLGKQLSRLSSSKRLLSPNNS